jgi:hypothetical protein
MKEPKKSPKRRGKLAIWWPRKLWRGAVAVVEDHPRTTLLVLLVGVGFTYFYGAHLRGMVHLKESFARWRIERFGGEHRVDRSVQIYDVLLSFEPSPLDRLDVVSMSSVHIGGRSFGEELQAIVDEPGGRVRVVTLDPRMSASDHPRHEEFVALGRAFGQEPWVFAAKVWHSVATLIELEERMGDGFEVRFVSEGLADANPPFLSPGRSAHAYHSADPDARVDIIVPRPGTPDGHDSLAHPAKIIRNRPEDADVVRFTGAFDSLWASGQALDGALKTELLERLDG